MQNMKVTRKGKKGPVPARLFILLARKSSFPLIFRRGPSKWVQLIGWDTKTDTFEFGQWFHGRIYERRTDLNPDGSLLGFFAQKLEGRTNKDNEYTYAWTAVSKPPYLTALALWPKGDCWHGGGLFENKKTLALNHRADVAKPHPKHLPKKLHIVLKNNVQGEDDPIFTERLIRDGWKLKQEWEVENRGYPKLFRTLQPGILEKSNRSRHQKIRLTRSIETLDYSEEFHLIVEKEKPAFSITIERASWADWDQQGRLIFARDGKFFSGKFDKDRIVETELIDLNSSKPKP